MIQSIALVYRLDQRGDHLLLGGAWTRSMDRENIVVGGLT